MKKFFFTLLCLLAVTFAFSQNSQKRIALVIGNAAYQHGNELRNPVNDANLITLTLQNLGFEVICKNDAGLKTMQLATAEFTNKISNYDVALFYYAGHGIQVDGENYLIPVDAKLDEKVMCQFEAFNINFINRAFQENSKNMNIMILDACRNNPFRSWMRGSGRGFRAISNQAAGTIIAFATRENETASDGVGNNGLFTEKLVGQMKKAQNITEVFQNTRIEVLNASNNAQCPQEWNMLTGNFYFVPLPKNNQIADNSTELKHGKVDVVFGSISIDSKLEGRLYLNGENKGYLKANSKGNLLEKVKPGQYTISLKGNTPWQQVVTVSKAQVTHVNIMDVAPKKEEKKVKRGATLSIITGGKAIKDNMVDIAKDCKVALSEKYNVIDNYPSSFTIKGKLKNWSISNDVKFVIKVGSSSKKVVINIFNVKRGKYEYIYTKIRTNQRPVDITKIVAVVSDYIENWDK